MLNYNHLYYFHMAATEGSIASAAQRLGVSQGTVSEQVRTLERTLRVSLFERQPGGLKLTEAGRLAFEHTSVMFRAGERLSEALGHDHGQLPRTLRIGLTGAVGRTTTANFLLPLLAIPGCVPSIRGGDAGELIRDLRANELDLVLCESEPPDSALNGLEVAVLDRMKLVAVAAPTLEIADDWSNVALVHYRPSSAFRWDIEEFLDERNLRPSIAAESDDSLFLIEAAARGGYVAFVPSTVARDAVAAGRLRALATLTPSHGGIHAIYQDGVSAELVRRAITTLIDNAHDRDDVAR
jgi:LysR family transcriptional regulator, transcriptional activator of nhaA